MAPAQQPLELILARNLIAALAIPAFLVDAEGGLLFYNDAAGELLGQRLEETGRLSPEEWRRIGPLDSQGNRISHERLPMRTALREGRPAHGRFHICTDQRNLVEIETSALPLLVGEASRGAIIVFWPVPGAQPRPLPR